MAKKKRSGDITAPLWFVSYADLVTNMLCFFVMLFAFSSLDSPKKRQESQSLEEKFHAVFSINSAVGSSQWLTKGGKGILLTPSSRKVDMPHLAKKVRNQLRKAPSADRMLVMASDQMIKIEIPSNVLFESGSAQMRRGAEDVLMALVPVIGTIDNYVRIDGHTDDMPTRSANFPSNWELSTARACSVVRFFIDKMQQDPARFSAQGYGEYRPKVPNTSEENREINRRVEMIILSTKKTVVRDFDWEKGLGD
ncbi:MAG: flagellar motor protein MotB [Candidatus Riflebacteria bacterium]|nr:flagellar motor protein MotB [Candidatus Riflebacteria bacterium]